MIKKRNVNHIMDLPQWKRKSKTYILFLIRFAETFAANFVPSVIGILLVFNNPNTKAWSIATIIAFICSLTVNCLCWNKYVKSKNSVKSFYAVNLTITLFYIALSVLMVHKTGYMLFTVMFSNLRVGEVIGLTTVNSVYVINGVMLVSMVVCERISSVRLNKHLSFITENGAEAVEMVNVDENVVPTRRDKEVSFLSPEELYKSDEDDAKRFFVEIEKEREGMPDSVRDENMTKGRGDKIEYEHDHEDEQSENANADYSADSLWDSGIYRGRTPQNIPITEYGEDDFEPDRQNDTDELLENAQASTELKNAKANASEIKEDESLLEDYSPDSLWSCDIRQGQGNAKIVFADDFDESVDDAEGAILSNYDSDSLWDNVSMGRAENTAADSAENDTNPNSEYDSDSIWNNAGMSRAEGTAADSNENDTNPNSKYDSDSLWDNVSMGRAEDTAVESNENDTNPNSKYDSDSLWDNVSMGRAESADSDLTENETNSNSEYDSDSLWDNVSMGRAESADSDLTENETNPNSEYDSHALWNKEIYQGTKKT